MSGPPFAIMRRGQQSIYHFLKCGWRFIGEESIHFFGHRWQPDEVERGAANKSDLIGGRPGFNVFGLECRKN